LEKLPKFMQTMDDEIYRKLEEIARERGINVQELIRAVIVPDWLKDRGLLKGAKT
jgi:predicted DNA-binding ribbon-helix-helix protein